MTNFRFSRVLSTIIAALFIAAGLLQPFGSAKAAQRFNAYLNDYDVAERETETVKDKADITKLLDEKGFLTDEGLDSLSVLPFEEGKFIEIENHGDGTESLKLFGSPIKYKNSDGKYEYIDNSIVETETKDGKKQYKNKASDISVVMSEDLKNSNAVELNMSGYKIAFQPLLEESEQSGLSAKMIEDTGKKDKPENKSVAYSNGKTDYVFTPVSTGLKEEIILYEQPSKTVFSFVITAEGATPLLRADGNLYFADLNKGLLVGAIPTPYMYDSTPEGGPVDIPVTLEKIDDKTYIYTLIPDSEYLKNANYPVTIDPSYNTILEGGLYDTWVQSNNSTNYCNSDKVIVGRSSAGTKFRGLFKMTPAALTSIRSKLGNYYVSEVSLHVYQEYSGSSSPVVEARSVLNDWVYNRVTWGTQPGLGGVLNTKTVQARGWYLFYFADLGRSWLAGSPNYGISLKIANENLNQYKEFTSYNASSNQCYFEYYYITPPAAPTNFRCTNLSSYVKNGSISLAWNRVNEATKYIIESDQAGFGPYTINQTTAPTLTINNVDDNKTFNFKLYAVDQFNQKSSFTPLKVETPDKTGPSKPVLAIDKSGWSNEDPTLTWTGLTDNSGTVKWVQYQVNGVWSGNIAHPTGSSLKIESIDTDGEYTIRLRGIDESGNIGTMSEPVTYKRDTTAPVVTLSADKEVIKGIVRLDGTASDSVPGSAVSGWQIEYGLGNPASSYITPPLISGTGAADSITYKWNTVDLAENQNYTVRITAEDAAGNQSVPVAFSMFKNQYSELIVSSLDITTLSEYDPDGLKPDVGGIDDNTINLPKTEIDFEKNDGGGTEGLSGIKLYVNNKQHAIIDEINTKLKFNADEWENGWVYPEGSIAFLYVQAKDSESSELFSTNTFNTIEFADAFANMDKTENRSANIVYADKSFSLSADGADSGSFESKTIPIAGDVCYIDFYTNETMPEGSSVGYFVSVNNGEDWEPIDETRLYFEDSIVGEGVKFKAELTKSAAGETPVVLSWSADIRYTTYANAVLIDNDFPANARGITGLNGTVIANGAVTLRGEVPFGQTQLTYAASGSIESTQRLASNEATEVCLEADTTIPEGTNITFMVSAQGGAENTWQTIEPGSSNDLEDWVALGELTGTEIVLRAELSRGAENITPSLNSWKLVIRQKTAGKPYIVKLVDEPWNLSAMPGANYMTLLRWEKSDTEGVTYNVYRSEDPYFVIGEDTEPIAQGLTENSWSDFNIVYDNIETNKKFYYKVTAVKEINGHERESLPSNEAWAEMVSWGEMNKRLGVQGYWSYYGVAAGSGAGQVNVSNGNLVYSATDMTVSDPFFSMVMSRTYNSFADTKTAMGYGWDFSFNTVLMKEYDSAQEEIGLLLKDGDGGFYRFAPDPENENSYLSPKGAYMELTYDETDNEYQIRRKDNITYHFDGTTMKLLQLSDPNDNELVFGYDAERGNLETVTNNVGDVLKLEYNVEGAQPGSPDYEYVNYHPDMVSRVIWTEDAASEREAVEYEYRYDEQDRLVYAGFVRTPADPEKHESYAYGGFGGNISAITDTAGTETLLSYDETDYTLAGAEYPNGDSVSFTFGENSSEMLNSHGISAGSEFDANGLVTKKTDALGQSVDYAYTDEYLVAEMSYENTIAGVLETLTFTYEYDSRGNLLSSAGPMGSLTEYGEYDEFNKPASVSVKMDGSRTLTTSFTYDQNGNLLTSTDPLGRTTTNAYTTISGRFGYLDSVADPFGKVTKYEYDQKGRVVETKEYIGSDFVRTAATVEYSYQDDDLADGEFIRVSAYDAMGNTTKTYSDKLGRTVRTVYPDGTTGSVSYNSAGNVFRTTAPDGTVSTVTYDEMYRPLYTTVTSGDQSVVPSVTEYGHWTSAEYPGMELDKLTVTDATGVKQITYLDPLGRTLKTSAKGSGAAEIVTAQYEYDMRGNCVKVTDAAGRITTAEYNALNQKTASVQKGSGQDAGDDITTSAYYDLLGNVLIATDGAGNETEYEYDDLSRMTKATQIVGSAELVTTYEYDDTESVPGTIINRVKDANVGTSYGGKVSETWFDPLGRKVKDLAYGNTIASQKQETSYEYDLNFRVTTAVRMDGTKEKFTYDDMGRVTDINYYMADVTDFTQPGAEWISYDYDDYTGELRESTVGNGEDPVPESGTWYAYDFLGRLTQYNQGDSGGGTTVNYEYDDAGRVTGISYRKDLVDRVLGYEYDAYGRLLKITHKLGSGAVKTVREYQYDSFGELASVKNFRDFNNDADAFVKIAYEKNALGRVTEIEYTDHANETSAGTLREKYTMAYDSRGYITEEIAYTDYASASTQHKQYEYDDAGRLTTYRSGPDAANPTDVRFYGYDNVGNRRTVTTSGETTTYNYDQLNRLLNTKDAAGVIQQSFSYDDRGNQTVNNTVTGLEQNATGYTYNLRNKLISAGVDRYTEDDSVENLYNADGKRVKRIENGETTNFFYNGSDLLFTTDQYGQLLTEDILGAYGEIVASARYDGTNLEGFYFYNYDAHENTSTIITSEGAMMTAYMYDAFGNEERSGSPSFLNEVSLSRSIRDKTTDLQYDNDEGDPYDTKIDRPLAYSDAGGYGDPDKERRRKMLAGAARRKADAERRKAAAARKRRATDENKSIYVPGRGQSETPQHYFDAGGYSNPEIDDEKALRKPLNTLPWDYPQYINWEKYIILSDKLLKKYKMGFNLNPEFLHRLAALCHYMTEKTGKLHTITISQGYRTEIEHNRNGSYTSWHENGLAIDTFHNHPPNKWLHDLEKRDALLIMFGLDNSVPNKEKVNAYDKDEVPENEYWHIQPIEVTSREADIMDDKRGYAMKFCYYFGLEFGFIGYKQRGQP